MNGKSIGGAVLAVLVIIGLRAIPKLMKQEAESQEREARLKETRETAKRAQQQWMAERWGDDAQPGEEAESDLSRAPVIGDDGRVEANGYKITFPAGTKITPKTDEIVTALFPGGGELMITTARNALLADASTSLLVSILQGKLQNAATNASDAFDAINPDHALLLTGTTNGAPINYIAGHVKTRQRVHVFLLVCNDQTKENAVAKAQEALATFEITERGGQLKREPSDAPTSSPPATAPRPADEGTSPD